MHVLGPFSLGGVVERPTARIAPEIELTRLQEHAARYAAFLAGPCPFKVGDVITPMADSMYDCHGRPHIVVEINESAAVLTPGMHLDVRVIGYHDDDCDAVKPGWIESWSWMLWTPELAQKARRMQDAPEGSA